MRRKLTVPPPDFHLVHYAGVPGAASKLRPLVVPPPPTDESSSKNKCSHTEQPATHRSRYRPWAELMKRAFEIDVLHCGCGGRLKLKALVVEVHNIERLLRHLGEPLQPPPRSPARDSSPKCCAEGSGKCIVEFVQHCVQQTYSIGIFAASWALPARASAICSGSKTVAVDRWCGSFRASARR